MAIYLTKEAADVALYQESAYFPEYQTPLTSALFESNEILQLINLGQAKSLKLNSKNSTLAVELVKKSLVAIIPEVPNINNSIKNAALSLQINGEYDLQTERLIQYFQTVTASLSSNVDGVVGRKTIKELDNQLNRIGGYDLETGRTILNHELAKKVQHHTVVSYDGADPVFVYDKPTLPNQEGAFFKLQQNDIIYVEYDLVNTAEGWFYIHILSASRSLQDSEGQKLYDSSFDESTMIKGFIPGAYIWKHWEDNNSPMPEMFSSIYRIPGSITDLSASHDELVRLIKTNYYDEVTLSLPNKDGIIDGTNKVTVPERTNFTLIAPYFKFCLNILIYVNNHKSNLDDRTDDERSIYLDSTVNWLTREDITAALDATEDDYSGAYYTNFYNALIGATATYNYVVNDQIKARLRPGFLMWIPSRQFVETLWQSLNHLSPINDIDTGFLTGLAKKAIRAVFPKRSLGYRFKLEAGATFGIPLGVDIVGDISIWREDTNSPNDTNLKISVYGEIRKGLDTGYGGEIGFWAGKKKNRDHREGIGIAAGLNLTAGMKNYVQIEFVIPVSGVDPITQNFAAGIYGAVGILGSAAFPVIGTSAMEKCMANLNFKIWNYITKFKVYNGNYIQGGGGLSAQFKYGDEAEEQDWIDTNISTPNIAPEKIMSLFSGATASIGGSVGRDMGGGIEVNFEYPFALENCYNEQTKRRIPSKFSITAFGEGQAHFDFFTSLGKGMFGLPMPAFLLEAGIGVKVSLEYDVVANNDNNGIITKNHSFTFVDILKKSKKLISIYNFSGDLDRYNGMAYEATYSFNIGKFVDDYINDSYKLGSKDLSLDFTSTLSNLKKSFDSANFKKRVNLQFFSRRLKGKSRRVAFAKDWDSKVNHFLNKGKPITGFQVAAYLDFNYSIGGDKYLEIIKAFFIFSRMGIAVTNDTITNDAKTYVSGLMDQLTDLTQTRVDRVQLAIDFYNDATLESYLDAYAPLKSTIPVILKITLSEIGERIGLWSETKDDEVMVEINEKIRLFFMDLVDLYFEEMINMHIALHMELLAGLGVSGSIAELGKIRANINVLEGLVLHSDLIYNNGFFPRSEWLTSLSELLGTKPLVYNGTQDLPETILERISVAKSNFSEDFVTPLIELLFDKQF